MSLLPNDSSKIFMDTGRWQDGGRVILVVWMFLIIYSNIISSFILFLLQFTVDLNNFVLECSLVKACHLKL